MTHSAPKRGQRTNYSPRTDWMRLPRVLAPVCIGGPSKAEPTPGPRRSIAEPQ